MTTLIDILIVEDDSLVLSMYNAAFSAFTNYSFIMAATGEEVEALLSTYSFRLGIIDIRLAGSVSGVDVGVLLHNKCPDMVLFAMTGLSCIFDNFDPAIAGFTTCFSKPIEFKNLLIAIRQVLD